MPEHPARPRRIPMQRRLALGVLKRVTVFATVLIGVGLIAYGISTRHDAWAPSPAIWIAGIIFLWTIPLQACMIPGFPSAVRRMRRVTPESLGLLRPPRSLLPRTMRPIPAWQERAA